jgi:hypothetical protein
MDSYPYSQAPFPDLGSVDHEKPRTAWVVDSSRKRFTGASRRGAKWKLVGSTKGREKKDRFEEAALPVKDKYLMISNCSSTPNVVGLLGQHLVIREAS